MIYTDPSKRHEFVVLFDVRDGNPNGDPDAGNLPRIDPETMHGLVTDVCLKRKIRDYAAVMHKKPIFIQSEIALNTLVRDAFRKAEVDPVSITLTEEETENKDLLKWLQGRPGLTADGDQLYYQGEEALNQNRARRLLAGSLDDDNRHLREALMSLARRLAEAAGQARQGGVNREARQKAREVLYKEYYDIRMFGAVLSTGLNAGQVRGPVQLTFARSISPIIPLDLAITRQARTTSERMLTGGTEIGRKPIVPYGLYRGHGFFNPLLAAEPTGTGVGSDDLRVLWEALEWMFESDRSAARGEMCTRGLWVFTHETDRGSAPAHRLFDLIRVRLKETVKIPRSFEDYEVTAPTDGTLETYGYPKVSLTCLVRP
jgi:CRISPR-associated protein Csd2